MGYFPGVIARTTATRFSGEDRGVWTGMADTEPAADPNNRDTPQTAQDLLPAVYEELRKLAAARMAGQFPC